MYTAFAFGARVGGGATSHCYPLNGNVYHPQIFGSAGIQAAYRNMLANSTLSGPTNFAPVIQATMSTAGQDQSRYTCLLILTDGEITDIDDTIACVALLYLPLYHFSTASVSLLPPTFPNVAFVLSCNLQSTTFLISIYAQDTHYQQSVY